ncbi:acyltransferase domain-containing protein [Streptomyces sp. M19]
MLDTLGALERGEPTAGVAEGTARTGGTVFVFPGQGSQWAGMALDLLWSSPVYAEHFQRCAAAVERWTDYSVEAVLRGDEGAPALERVDVVQPVLWTVMVALAELWRAHGVEPTAVVGHSQGEIAAACVAGVLSVEDAARIVALRSRALLELSGRGGMVSVPLASAEVEDRLKEYAGRLGVAAVNGPSSTVVSGDIDAVDELLAAYEAEGVRAKRIPVDYASHSTHIDTLRERLRDALSGIEPRQANIPLYSTVTGEVADGTAMDADYWYTNLRQPVLFEHATRLLLDHAHTAFLEISPHPVVTTGVQETIEAAGAGAVALGTLRREEGGPERFLAALAQAYAHGVAVDWTQVYAGQDVRALDLPTYAFQRERYWLEPTVADTAEGPALTGHEADFWRAVENEDLTALTDTLDLDGEQPLSAVLPALSSWRRRHTTESTVDSWRYRTTWQPVDPGAATLTGTWLVVASTHGDAETATAVTDALADAGAKTVTLALDPAGTDREDLAQRVYDLLADGTAPQGVVSLLGLDDRPHDRFAHVTAGLTGTLALLQALDDAGAETRLWALTRGAVTVGATEHLDSPAQAQVWGLGRVAALEYPSCGAAWSTSPASPAPAPRGGWPPPSAGTAARTNSPYAPPACGPAAWSAPPCWGPSPYAGGARAAPSWSPAAPAASATTSPAGSPTSAPSTSSSPGAAANAPRHGRTRRRTRRVRHPGHPAACDVTDRAALASLVAEVEAAGPPIRTVIHAAAAIELMPLAYAGPDHLADNLAAKAVGARHLDELFDRDTLDAFVLFSSVAGYWGSGDHGAYAAAGAYVDALAQARRARGLTATSVSWSFWGAPSDPADQDPATREMVERAGQHGLPHLDTASALAALHLALDHDDTTVAVADIGWERFVPVFTSGRPSHAFDQVPEALRVVEAADGRLAPTDLAQASLLRQRLAGLDTDERRSTVLDLVGGHVAAVLGHTAPGAVGTDRAFKELGFDSITAVELRNRLGAATGLNLPPPSCSTGPPRPPSSTTCSRRCSPTRWRAWTPSTPNSTGSAPRSPAWRWRATNATASPPTSRPCCPDSPTTANPPPKAAVQ